MNHMNHHNPMVASHVLLTFQINSTPIWRLGNLATRETSIDKIRIRIT